MNEGKLSVGTKLGYAIGAFGDTIPLNIFNFYFLFFLTDIAGVSPAKAGMVSSIAVLWNAVLDPFVGYLSDNSKSKYGRRRSFMIRAILPYGICMFLIFSDLNLPQTWKIVYFTVIAVAYYTCYTTFVIPFFALGGELTDDFEERTSVRAWGSAVGYGTMILALALPPAIVSFVDSRMGGTLAQGWRTVGAVFAVIIIVGMLTCVLCTKGKEAVWDVISEQEKEAGKNLFQSYWEILKLRPVRFLGITVILWAIVSSIASGGAVYMLENNFHVTAGQQSLYFTCIGLFSMAWTPVINGLGKRFDKKHVYCYAMLCSGIALCAFGIVGVKSFEWAIGMALLFTFGNTTFYTVYFSLMYDLNELDEYVNGKERIGALAGLMDLIQKCGTAISMQLLGMFLQLGGYGVSGQETEAAETIIYANTLVPGVFGVCAGLLAIAYPVTRARHKALKKALEQKKRGESYSEKEFEKLIRR